MNSALRSCALAMAIGLGAASAPAAIVVTFTPSSQHVEIGEIVQIDVSISGLGAEILSAFDLNFRYDGGVMHWSAINAGPASEQLGESYGAAPIFTFDTLVEGDLGLQGSALELDPVVAANQADSFLLFRFAFTGAADGVTSFGLGSDPDFERNFVGLDALTLDVSVGSACVAVGTGQCIQVPEPPVWTLAGLGLAAAGLLPALRRRDRRLLRA